MESQNLDAIASELQKQRTLEHQKATALRSDLWTVEKNVARIDAALVALSGEAVNAGTNGLTTKRPKRTLQNPSAKKADVIAAMRQILEKEQLMEAEALKKQVADLLTKNGFNRFGFAMRWNEASRDKQFIVTPKGMSLVEKAAVTSNGRSTVGTSTEATISTPEAP